MNLRFHWRLLEGGERRDETLDVTRHDSIKGRPDLDAQSTFCRDAEEAGVDSLLVDFGFAKPDSTLLSAALAGLTSGIRFMVASRPGLMSPTLFVQQINTLSAMSGGRVSLNIVAGHSPQEQAYYGDPLSHDRRYERMAEFLEVCRAFWKKEGPIDFEGRYYTIRGGKLNTPFVSPDRTMPEIYVGGNSAGCQGVATRLAHCWMRFPTTPDRLAEEIRPALDAGVEVGLRLAVIARPTRKEAIGTARELVGLGDDAKGADERSFVGASDSESIRAVYAMAADEWLTPSLWTGAVRRYGAPSVALLGSYDEVAEQLVALGSLGVSQFILSGWPKWGEMIRFGKEVIPRVRRLEATAESSASDLRRSRAHVNT